jgi:hypothetical protein
MPMIAEVIINVILIVDLLKDKSIKGAIFCHVIKIVA